LELLKRYMSIDMSSTGATKFGWRNGPVCPPTGLGMATACAPELTNTFSTTGAEVCPEAENTDHPACPSTGPRVKGGFSNPVA
jgi:hypothetical protein